MLYLVEIGLRIVAWTTSMCDMLFVRFSEKSGVSLRLSIFTVSGSIWEHYYLIVVS